MRTVEMPMVLVKNKPRMCILNSVKETFLPAEDDVIVPHASSCSSVRLHGLLYLVESHWNSSITSASLLWLRRYLGVSLRRITVIRKIDITNTRAPEVYQM